MKKQLLIASIVAAALIMSAPVMAKSETTHRSAEHHRVDKVAMQGKLNINTASASELAGLKRIGAKKAAAIVAYRNANGAFKSVDDLSKVKGISQKIVEANRASLNLS